MREPVGGVPPLGYDRVQQEKTNVARLAKVTGGPDCKTFSLASNGSRSHENTSHTFNCGSIDVVQNIDRTSPGRSPLSPDAAFVTKQQQEHGANHAWKTTPNNQDNKKNAARLTAKNQRKPHRKDCLKRDGTKRTMTTESA